MWTGSNARGPSTGSSTWVALWEAINQCYRVNPLPRSGQEKDRNRRESRGETKKKKKTWRIKEQKASGRWSTVGFRFRDIDRKSDPAGDRSLERISTGDSGLFSQREKLKRQKKEGGDFVYKEETTAEIRSGRIFAPSLRRSGGTNGRYLRHFEELGQFGHPVEERLVDLQSFFALVLLHVEVFLCVSEDQNQQERKQKTREK